MNSYKVVYYNNFGFLNEVIIKAYSERDAARILRQDAKRRGGGSLRIVSVSLKTKASTAV